ncbi:hypothetical protein HYV49_01070 [Candidatus Pacearchaeota archaeon]|nr:hypothetical protein [Candidatus Pacearchaeota archaeon]
MKTKQKKEYEPCYCAQTEVYEELLLYAVSLIQNLNPEEETNNELILFVEKIRKTISGYSQAQKEYAEDLADFYKNE